jgi:hypothetical protein
MRGERRVRLAAGRATVLACALCAAAALVNAGRGGASGARQPQATQFQSPAAASIDPNGVDFGEQVIGRWGRAHRVVVTNTGGAPLHVNNAALRGDDAGRYSVVNDTCTGGEVVPYRACIIDIAFLPTGKDDFDAELTLVSDAPESPQTIRVTGEGINSAMVPPGSLGR